MRKKKKNVFFFSCFWPKKTNATRGTLGSSVEVICPASYELKRRSFSTSLPPPSPPLHPPLPPSFPPTLSSSYFRIISFHMFSLSPYPAPFFLSPYLRLISSRVFFLPWSLLCLSLSKIRSPDVTFVVVVVVFSPPLCLSLFLSQDKSIRVAVVGLSTNLNVLDVAEKRVKSRFSFCQARHL